MLCCASPPPFPFKTQGNFDDAERAYNNAIKYEPRNTSAVKEKAQVVAIRTLFQKAQAALLRVRVWQGVGSWLCHSPKPVGV
jgi:Flp pilus assembly protein TadD